MYPHLLESHPLHKECIWDLLPYSYQWCMHVILYQSYHETKIFQTAGYTYFKGEFRRQYLSEDIIRREQETLSFLERIDANIPDAKPDFKSFWLNTAADIKGYMNVSGCTPRGLNYVTTLWFKHVEMCNSWFMETYQKVKSAHSQLSLKLACR